MPNLPVDDDFQRLKEALPLPFQEHLLSDIPLLIHAWPLLSMLCEDRELIARVGTELDILKPELTPEKASVLTARFQALEEQFNPDSRFKYRLPVVLSEFPIHSRAINQRIQIFNEAIESLHQENSLLPDAGFLEDSYQDLLAAVQVHGSYCDSESLWQLLGMAGGWSRCDIATLLQLDPAPASSSAQEPDPTAPLPMNPLPVIEVEQPLDSFREDPFLADYNYSINQAGRLSKEIYVLLLNLFGMKIGGHFDAQVKYAPRFIPLTFFHTMIRRQLSHRMEIWPTSDFEFWIETSLHRLGLVFIKKDNSAFASELLINPFFSNPISFLSPEKIHSVLMDTLDEFINEALDPNPAELTLLSQYLFELLQAFQFNPGQALGIGANWDGTVNLSNESGAEAFRFKNERWGRRFKNLSLHRQGPSEARMNAAIGIKIELQTLLSDFDYMSQLQPSEYPEVIYNAIIDNLVSELFPEPPYFENTAYPRYQKHYIVKRNAAGLAAISSFLEPSAQGTWFIDRAGNEKQTPMYRRAGTLDVQAFPRNSTYSDQSRNCYEGNPLGPLQLQYAQALHRNARGHIVYDPIGPDQFLEDPFFGQVIRADNGDFLPFIGVIPKNFDRHFGQEPELCASFVTRMLQSSAIMELCPTFKLTIEQMKTRFLPSQTRQAPEIPVFCSDYLISIKQALDSALGAEVRSFASCHKQFHRLFKNLIYSLYEIGRPDPCFQQTFLEFIQSADLGSATTRASCDKIIRDLRINKPVYLSPEALSRYDDIIAYLRALTTCFYPEPSDDLARDIAQFARQQVSPLLESRGISLYFRLKGENKQANLSRKQTPGMLYSSLKHKGPSSSIIRDYNRMHTIGFPSYYRDPDGSPNGEPQWIDRLIDGGAKILGGGLQFAHRYHLFSLFHKPLTAPVLHAREQAITHQGERLKPLWIMGGAIEGFFWHGLLKGLWRTTTTPFMMLADFCSWQYQWIFQQEPEPLENPLAIPAAPANESSLRTQAAAQTRDFLLYLLDRKEDLATKRTLVLGYSLNKISKLYPDFDEEDLALCHQLLDSKFPLCEEEWTDLFNSLLTDAEEALCHLLQRYNSCINKALILAVFRCLTHPLFQARTQFVLKETTSFYTLNTVQTAALTRILRLYQQSNLDTQQQFFHWFRFNGPIHRRLQRRDQYLQRIQSHILHVFDKQWIIEFLFDARLEKLVTELDANNLEKTINQLPESIKGPLYQLLRSDDPHRLDQYNLSEQERYLLFKIQTLLNNEDSLIKAIMPVTAISCLSPKEKAHRLWARFTEQELKNQFPCPEESKQIIDSIKEKAPTIRSRLDTLHTLYQQPILENNQALDDFYEFAERLLMDLAGSGESQDRLNGFINTTMKIIVNARLARVSIADYSTNENPLANTIAIETWLNKIYQHTGNFRSLLDQQFQQAPSIDHTLWRDHCILQILEQQNPGKKIAGTGIQALLRIRMQHPDNITSTCQPWFNPDSDNTEEISYGRFFQGSKTMEYGIRRVQEKQMSQRFITPLGIKNHL